MAKGKSTINNNGGGDAGVGDKTSAAIASIAAMKQTGMPYGKGAKLPIDAAVGGQKKQ